LSFELEKSQPKTALRYFDHNGVMRGQVCEEIAEDLDYEGACQIMMLALQAIRAKDARGWHHRPVYLVS
jgi:hypothetical protein